MIHNAESQALQILSEATLLPVEVLTQIAIARLLEETHNDGTFETDALADLIVDARLTTAGCHSSTLIVIARYDEKRARAFA